jgi:WD40 repeat protein
LFIWKTSSGEFVKKYTLDGKNLRGIKCCAFSEDTEYVAFVDKSDKFNVYVLKVSTGQLHWTQATGGQEVYGIAWSKNKADHTFATCGDKHITFWNADKKESTKGTGHGAQTFLCVTFDDKGACYAGGANGSLYIFDEKGKVQRQIQKIHKGAIQAITFKENKLLTAGMDTEIKEISISGGSGSIVAKTKYTPKAIDIKGAQLVVGDKGGNITLYEYHGGPATEIRSWSGHHDGELWGIETTDKEVLTSCEDNKFIVWDYNERKAKATNVINSNKGQKIKGNAGTSSSFPDNQCSRALCFNKSTGEIAISTCEGEVQIRKMTDLKTVAKSIKCAERWIEVMSYSPDGKWLAVGTHNSNVCLYDVPDYKLAGTFPSPSSIVGLDWSLDSRYIRSLDEGMTLKFWLAADKKQDTNGATATRDLEWATQYVKLGWHVMGIFPAGVQFSNIKGVARSPDGKFMATGDDWGQVNIYNFPAGKGAKCITLRFVVPVKSIYIEDTVSLL